MTEGGPQHESSDPRPPADPQQDLPSHEDSTHSRAAGGDPSASDGPSMGEGSAPTQRRPRLPVVDNQPTVISKRPPVSDSAAAALSTPVEMGLMLEGERLGHFLLEEFVGGGGMGAVFRSVDTLLNRTVAVKVLSQRQSQDGETVRRFKQEAQSAARLDHDNIARVYFVGEHEAWHFIVFEFIEGTNIRDLVDEQGPLAVNDAVAFTLQTAEALAHACERDVVHRDIKPSNILITPLGRAKLVDMGLARLQQVEASGDDLTASGVTLGTFDYISPEQARDPRSADVRSDLYSLGCSLYYMLVGRPPFPGGTVLQKLLSHTSDTPPDPRALRPDLPESLVRILSKLLAKRPDARYQHPRELIGELLLLADELGLPVATHGGTVWLAPVRKAEETWRRHLPWAASVAALLATVLVLDMQWSKSSDDMRDLPAPRIPAAAVATSLPVSPPPDVPREIETLPRGDAETPPAQGIETGGAPAADNGEESASPVSSSPPSGGTRVDLRGSGLSSEGFGVALGPEGLIPAEGRLGPSGEGSVTRAGTGAAGGAAQTRRAESPSGQVFNPLLVESLIVQVGGSGSIDATTSVVDSLEEACAMLRSMPNVTLIELEYNGVRQEPAVSLANQAGRRITIRAAPGFRPEILFRPAAEDPVSNPRTMIQISGGSVTLEGLTISMEIPPNQVDDWALVGIEEAELLELMGCRLTIRNARSGRATNVPNVAFFEMSGRDRLQLMMLESEGPRTPLALDIEDSVIRGEATLVRASASQPLRLTWSNGLLATTERLLKIRGASRAARAGEHVQLELSHVTAVVDKGLCLATTEENHPYQLPLDVRAADCILITRHDQPLFAQQGVQEIEEAQELLLYDGRRNFYEGSDLFWEIDAPTHEVYLALGFEEWKAKWGTSEKRPAWQAVRWQHLPEADRAIHLHEPSDYAFSEAALPRGTEFDPRQSNAGFDARQLTPRPARLEPPVAPAPMPLPLDEGERGGTTSPSERPGRSGESA